MRIASVRLNGGVQAVALAAMFAGAAGGCVVHVAPPPTPDKVIPQLTDKAEPPGEGEGQVVVDATNGPASVTLIVGAFSVGTAYGSADSVVTKPVCATTPCVVNLPVGTHELIFAGKRDVDLASSDAVQVTRTPSVFRHTVGRVESSPGLLYGGLLGATVGGATALTGAIFLTSSETRGTGLVTFGLGAAITAVGAGMMYYGRTRIQPGSSVQFTPDGATPPVDKSSSRQVMLTPNGVGFTF
jgi:hypothetical protein